MQINDANLITVEQAARALSQDLCLTPVPSSAQKWWSFELFGRKIFCYNFDWRREALFYHDLHHVVTGFPCTIRGECQVAAWEFSAGRYPNIFANLFCLPLILLGMLTGPCRTLQAFLAGQKATTFYGKELGAHVGSWPLKKLKALTIVDHAPPPCVIQLVKFCGWLLSSVALTLGTPIVVYLVVMQFV